LAHAALQAGDADTAIEAATRALEKEADDPELLGLRAEARLRSNRFADALPDVERLEALDPDDRGAVVMRLRCLIGLDKLDEAEKLFAELEKRTSDPDVPGATDELYCTARASFAKEKGDAALAEQRFERCLETYPTSPVLVREAVAFFDGIQRPERSNEILRAVLAQEPTQSEVRELLAMRPRERGQAKEAAALLLDGTKLERAVAYEAWGGLASHYFQTGDYAASVSAWEQVLKLRNKP